MLSSSKVVLTVYQPIQNSDHIWKYSTRLNFFQRLIGIAKVF